MLACVLLLVPVLNAPELVLLLYSPPPLTHPLILKVLQWDTSYSMVLKAVKVSDSVLALDVWSHFLAIGSTTIQLVDMCSKKLKRIMLVDMDSADEEDPLVSMSMPCKSQGLMPTIDQDHQKLKSYVCNKDLLKLH